MSSTRVVEIPCRHPSARDGFFYCVPSYLNSDYMRGRFEFMMVNTQKTIAKLRRENPKLLTRAEGAFNGTTVEEWLKHMTPAAPLDMGHWAYNRATGLSMSSGQAAMITLVQQLALPCFPIAVSRPVEGQLHAALRDQIGYGAGHVSAARGDLSEFLRPVAHLGGHAHFVQHLRM